MNSFTNNKLVKWINIILCSILVIIIFLCSWFKSPDLGTNIFLPDWLNKWSNIHGQIRTAIPFIPLGFLLNTYKKKWIISISGFLICFLVVIIAELGQFLIPTRYPDIFDVLSGLLGAVVGMFFQNLIKKN